MGFNAKSSRGVRNEINVTPLVDVVLVLLIIFMVVTPMLQRGKDVHLPKATKSDAENKQADPLTLSVTRDKHVWVEEKQVDEASLGPALQRELAAKPGRKVLVKGDEALTVGEMRKVMDAARAAGAKGVSLGIEEIKKH